MRNWDSCRCWRCKFCPCKVRNRFLVNFWNCTIHLWTHCINPSLISRHYVHEIWCMCDRASYMKMTRGTNLIQQLWFIIINISTCFGHQYAHLQEYRLYVTAYGVQHCKRELGVNGWFRSVLCNCWFRLCCMLFWVHVPHNAWCSLEWVEMHRWSEGMQCVVAVMVVGTSRHFHVHKTRLVHFLEVLH